MASQTTLTLDQFLSLPERQGSLEVWLLYPDTQRLYVYTNDKRDPQAFKGNERFVSILGYEFEASPFFEI